MILKISKFKNAEKIVYLVFILIPIFQLINSFVMYSNGESMLGKVFRLMTLIILLLICKGQLAGKTLPLLLLLSTACFITICVDAFRGIDLGLIEWINSLLKLLSPIIYYGCLKKLYDKGRLREKVTHEILIFWAIFLSLSMIIPYAFGIGHYTYEGNGYTGLYYENDSLNIALCCLVAYVLNSAVNNKKKSFYILSLMLLFSIAITGSKTGIIYSIIIVLYILLLNKKISLAKFLKRLFITIGIVILALVIINNMEGNIISKQLTYYAEIYKWSTTAGGDTPLAVLTNGRTKKAIYCVNNLWNSDNMLDVLFGIGGYGAEMDFFDTYMKFGIFPIIIIFIICFMVMKKCTRHNIYSFGLLLILIYAFIAGHVVESSFTCGLIAIFVLSLDYKSDIGKNRTYEVKNGRNLYHNAGL